MATVKENNPFGYRTSDTHPLYVAELQPGASTGKIGITFLPGKNDTRSGGTWARNLHADLDAIVAWNASAIVTLTEADELRLLQVPNLGKAAVARHIDWVHLPIVYVSVPDQRFEEQWALVGEGLRARLRDGFNILVHCRGGIGRAGTIASRLMIEFGHTPEEALHLVRSVRPSAVETTSQERYVLQLRECAPAEPSRERDNRADRAIGALIGLAVGDALGTTLEFTQRDDKAPQLIDMVGGGPFELEVGQWTDDTAMALALADSLISHPDGNPMDLMRRFVLWRRKGEYSCTGTCFDIGETTRSALRRFKLSGDPLAGSKDPFTAGNGSLMRLSPVAIRHWNAPEKRRQIARMQSQTTHGAEEAVAACELFADLLAEAIGGVARHAVLAPRDGEWPLKVRAISRGGWRGKPREGVRSGGYVLESLEAALWCVGSTSSFRDAVLKAANLREDADTTAAITGQLAGALYGASAIPATWRRRLAWNDIIEDKAKSLFDAAR